MIIKRCDFVTSAAQYGQYPESDLPEVAFVGRSNVGKSSLINSMLNRKSLVKVSSKPGKTRLINFFVVNEELMLVDLPGYGYAAVSRGEKEKWGRMIEDYLTTREILKSVVLLVDIRHKPTGDDKLMYDFIKFYRGKVIVVATKWDKITKNAYRKNMDIIKNTLNLDEKDLLLPYSSETHQGREELWDIITNSFY
ncbi:MAG: YihA family ribosome biogenesis GTP-binding protein [Clostridiales bacterium GWB2_37_7]|nr:MAG: YihA family ribosome biogenesis GTP-binding protein [Clostridiales bacterium GWB2_37_7]